MYIFCLCFLRNASLCGDHPPVAHLVAPGTVLRSAQLVHLGHTLLELLILALLVGVTLGL